MICDVISTGSGGNAVRIGPGGRLLVDCGVSYKRIEPFKDDLELVLLTHRHSDHFKESTVRRIAQDRPAVRWAMGEHMLPLVDGVLPLRCIDVLRPDIWVRYKTMCGCVVICPVSLQHDVPNFGYHIIFQGECDWQYRVFYATDTGTLDGISAKGYDLYLIEANHTEEDLRAREAEKLAAGVFSYEARAALTHLSQERAAAWLAKNAGKNSRVVWLHQHTEREGRHNDPVDSGLQQSSPASENIQAGG